MGPAIAQVGGVGVDVLANGLATSPITWIAALSLFANVYMFRQLQAQAKDFDARVEAIRAAQLEATRQDGKEQVALLMQVLPLSSKLGDAVELAERLSHRGGT